jgi:hypothetical protein
MIICFKAVFNLVLSISKTHPIVKLETFPHLHRARPGFGRGRGAALPPPNIGSTWRGARLLERTTWVWEIDESGLPLE